MTWCYCTTTSIRDKPGKLAASCKCSRDETATSDPAWSVCQEEQPLDVLFNSYINWKLITNEQCSFGGEDIKY